jgi:predicted dinucleotide-binding enzyme
MKIAVIGAGNVGATLGRRFSDAGHEVTFGVPEPQEHRDGNLAGPIASVREAAAGAEAVLLAVPFAAAKSVVEECGGLAGKIVIDATNPLGMTPDGLNLTVGFTSSGVEEIAEAAPEARFVKCFNQTGFANMADPRGSMMFVCGDDADANEVVRKLAADIGFDAITIGGLAKARLLEPLAMLWIHLSATTDLKRDFAFRIDRH